MTGPLSFIILFVCFLSYNIESYFRGPNTPSVPTVKDQRQDRLLNEILNDDGTPKKINVTIFDKNQSDS